MANDLLTLLLSGGLASCLIAIFTLRSKVRQSAAEARKAELDNSDKATSILLDHIVNPLKVELNDTRHELALLRKAIQSIRDCTHADDCPVLHELRVTTANCPVHRARDADDLRYNRSRDGTAGTATR